MRRVVVTGLGMVTPLGCGVEATWRRLVAGESAASRIEKFQVADLPAQIACQIPRGDGSNGTFNPDQWMEPKEQRKVDEFIVYAMCAATQAIEDSGWKPASREDQIATGVMIGSGIGGLSTIYETSIVLKERGARRVSPFFIPSSLINLVSGQVSIKYGFRGPNHSVVTACATGAHAIGDAARLIMLEDADVMVAGGAEAAICRLGIAGFNACKALSTDFNDTPAEASRPWDKRRDGFVMGEGAAVLVLERAEHAAARGATAYALIAGYGASNDAFHITQPAEDGRGAADAMRAALNDAGASTSDAGYLNAHGTGTPFNDRIETVAVHSVFNGGAPPVSSTKSNIGHLLGAAGAVEALTCVEALRRGVLPPTLNLEQPDPECDLDHVAGAPREAADIELALSNSFGFGGQNACLAVAKA